ncbi:MAG TPA: GNAT family N-acetyltransferase [Caproicibacter sp.]|nr:GNAT family N-acetyltransferase [Caproicibacter sp.]
MQKAYETKIPNVVIRFAEESDTKLILQFIRELAEYEKMEKDVTATEEILRDSLFHRNAAETIVAEKDGRPVGFALFFHNFSTFLGKPGIYLEDLFVRPEARGLGVGKALLAFLAKLAVERGCGRFEWWCLDWNKPSIEFYKSMGAKPMDDWTVYRVDGNALINLAEQF